MSSQDKVLLQLLRSADVLSGGAAEICKHFDGESYPKLPDAESLEFGEIALNIAKDYEVIAIKNYDGEVVYLPFNVAIRLLDVEKSLDELSGYTLSSVEYISGETVAIYDDVQQFKTDIQNRINDEVSRLENEFNDKLNNLSGKTQSELDDLKAYVNELSSTTNTLSDSISEIDTELGIVSNDLSEEIDSLSGSTHESISEINEKIDSLSAETDSKIESTFSGITESFYEVKNEIEEELAVFSGETQHEIALTNKKIDDAISGVTEDIDSVKIQIESEIVDLSGNTQESIDNLNLKIDTISSGLTVDIERVKEEIEGEIAVLGSDVDQSLGVLDDKINALSASTSERFDNVASDIEEAVSDAVMLLSGDIITVSASTNDHIDDVENGLRNDIYVLSGETDYKINQLSESLESKIDEVSSSTDNKLSDVWDKIEEISGATGQVSSATTEYVDEKFAEAEAQIDVIGDVVDDLIVDIQNTEYEVQNLNTDISKLSGDVITLSASTESSFSDVSDKIDALNDKIDAIPSRIENLEDEFNANIESLSSTTETLVGMAVANAVSSSNQYTDNKISNLNAATKDYVDNQIALAKSDIESDIDEKTESSKNNAISVSQEYTDQKIEDVKDETKVYVTGQLNEMYDSVTATTKTMVDEKADITLSAATKYADDAEERLNDRVDAVSTDTDDKIGEIHEEIENIKLSDLSDVEIIDDGGELEILAKSGDTWTNKIVGIASEEKYGVVKIGSGIDVENGVISAQKIEVDSEIVSGSTNPVSGGAVYNSIQSISGNIESISDKTAELEDSLSALTGDFNDFSASTASDIESLSGSVSACTSICEELEEIELVHAGAFAKIKQSLGFDENAEYIPTYEPLNTMTVTEAIDYVGQCTDEINRDTERLEVGIQNDEIVHAGAFSRMNHSLGFDNNAEYVPSCEALDAMSVTEAIDYLCQSYEEIERYLGSEDTKQLIRSVTYESLCKLYANKKLRYGILYRITNYQATVNSDDYTTRIPVVESGPFTSMGFDIVVRAASNCTLDENAWAVISNGNNYFEDCAVNSWQLKYSLINDVGRFDWADKDGFGVIYYMKDEYGNEAPYDFKNIKNVFSGGSKYTFHDPIDNSDMSITGKAACNVINPYYISGNLNRNLLGINMISIIGQNAKGNIFGCGCNNIRLIGDFVDNKISASVSDKIIEETFTGKLIGYQIVDFD